MKNHWVALSVAVIIVLAFAVGLVYSVQQIVTVPPRPNVRIIDAERKIFMVRDPLTGEEYLVVEGTGVCKR